MQLEAKCQELQLYTMIGAHPKWGVLWQGYVEVLKIKVGKVRLVKALVKSQKIIYSKTTVYIDNPKDKEYGNITLFI
jgi:hypothetical protein